MRAVTEPHRPLQEVCARLVYVAIVAVAFSSPAWAAGTPAGTLIEGTATVDFDYGGTPFSINSNTTVLAVAERIDVATVLQSPQQLVSASDTRRALLFTVTNTGNGTETFALAIDNLIAGDDFDPVAAVPAIYFDTDGSGDLTAADQAYTAGTNDPVLAADASIDIFLVNDIPAAVGNGDIGRSQLTATSATGTGAAGTVYAGAGDTGVDAVIGTTGGESADTGEYIVSDIQVTIVKSQAVADPFGGTEPLPGATITYTITVDLVGSGTATASIVRDPVPTYTTYVPGSLVLNGIAQSDAADADAGELDTAVVPTIVVRLGDLTLASGTQTIVFQVSID